MPDWFSTLLHHPIKVGTIPLSAKGEKHLLPHVSLDRKKGSPKYIL